MSTGQNSKGQSSKGKDKVQESGKMQVTLHPSGAVTGRHASKWSSRVGKLIRQIVPVHIHDWRLVENHFLKDVWSRLMEDFEVVPEMDDAIGLNIARKKWAQFFRSHKSSLRGQLAIADDYMPQGHDPDVIERFLASEKDPKKVKQRNDGSANRRKSVVSHNLGRDSYARRAEKKAERDPEFNFESRDEMWLLGHENESGECASDRNIEIYQKVKDARDKRRGTQSSVSIDFDCDAVAEVLGRDKKGRIRGMGSGVSKKQLEALHIAQLSQKQGRSLVQEEVRFCMKDVTKDIIEGIMGAIDDRVDKRMMENAAGTPLSDKGSNSAQQRRVEPLQTVDEDEHFSPGDELNPPVVLINRKKKAVAKGLLVTDSHKKICHGRPVARNERKVFIQQVIDSREPPLHPDFEDKLTEMTWTTWPVNQLIFMG